MINYIIGKADTVQCISKQFWTFFLQLLVFLISKKVPFNESLVTKDVGMKYFLRNDFSEMMFFSKIN